jgi:hypothetical protein
MWHVFQFFVGQMPESIRAIKDVAAFLGKHIETRESTAARQST